MGPATLPETLNPRQKKWNPGSLRAVEPLQTPCRFLGTLQGRPDPAALAEKQTRTARGPNSPPPPNSTQLPKDSLELDSFALEDRFSGNSM